jgi:GNAT superfamily N-acetyltransferase
VNAPDMIGHVDGWRLFKHADDARLHSITQQAVWPADAEMMAGCPYAGSEKITGRLTHNGEMHLGGSFEQCRCGLYAKRSLLDLLLTYNVLDPVYQPCVVARVKLWGEVVEGRVGFRATRGYVAEMYLVVAPGARRRGVACNVETPTAILEDAVERFGEPAGHVDLYGVAASYTPSPQPFVGAVTLTGPIQAGTIIPPLSATALINGPAKRPRWSRPASSTALLVLCIPLAMRAPDSAPWWWIWGALVGGAAGTAVADLRRWIVDYRRWHRWLR